MSGCEARFEQISALIDGELQEAEAEELRAHIALCPECAAVYAALSGFGEALTEDVPAGLHDKIMQGVDDARRAQKSRRSFRALRPVLAAAACLVVIVGTVFFTGNLTKERSKNAVPAAGGAQSASASYAMKSSGAASAAGEAPAAAAPMAPMPAPMEDGAAMDMPAEEPAPMAPDSAEITEESWPESSLFAANASDAAVHPQFSGILEEIGEDGMLRVTVTEPGTCGLSEGDSVLVVPPEERDALPEPGEELDFTLTNEPVTITLGDEPLVFHAVSIDPREE